MTISLIKLKRRTEPQGEILVCDNCLHARESAIDLRTESSDGDPSDPEPWSLDPNIEVTLGRFWEDHSCGKTDTDHDYDCECEYIEFSTTSCDGCGQHLHGTRHYYTYWA